MNLVLQSLQQVQKRILNIFRVIPVDGTWPNNWTQSQVNKLTLPVTMSNHVVSQEESIRICYRNWRAFVDNLGEGLRRPQRSAWCCKLDAQRKWDNFMIGISIHLICRKKRLG